MSPAAALTDRTRRRDAKQTRLAIGMKVIRHAFTRSAGITEGRADPARCRNVNSQRDAVKPALPYFPCDKGVQARVVDNNKSPGAPANGSSRNEPERSGHAILLFLAGAFECLPIITNS